MKRVQLNGADIEYDVRGSGAPVVFIHGSILSDGFVPVIEQPGIAENFKIVHYRRRGYALSSRAVAGMTMQGWAGQSPLFRNSFGYSQKLSSRSHDLITDHRHYPASPNYRGGAVSASGPMHHRRVVVDQAKADEPESDYVGTDHPLLVQVHKPTEYREISHSSAKKPG